VSAELHVQIARDLTRRILAGDVDGVGELYHDELTAWRSHDLRTLARKQALRVVEILSRQLRELRYEDVRIQPTPDGFVQQHVMRCLSPKGEPVEAHICLVARIRDGRIAHIDEYMDSAQMAPLMR
jgi:ketosteroid isomerase-like protein